MREIIRHARGTSALGDFVVAASETAIVFLEFSSQPASVERQLRARFPESVVVNGQDEMADILEKVRTAIEHPGSEHRVSLDLRGTSFQVKVWTMLLSIPAGETTSYGALARDLGTRDARDVTDAIASNQIAVLVPCHRVIKKDGSISGYRWGVNLKRTLLAREQANAEFRLV